MNLLELLKRPEGKTLEFKRDLSSPEGVLRSLVAFANTAGFSQSWTLNYRRLAPALCNARSRPHEYAARATRRLPELTEAA